MHLFATFLNIIHLLPDHPAIPGILEETSMNIVKPLWHSILAIGIGLSPAGGLEKAIAQDQTEQATEQAKGQTLESEDAKQAGEQIKHDHSETFYTKTYSSKNIHALEDELKKHPTGVGYFCLTDLLCEVKQFKKAKKIAEKSIVLAPTHFQGYQNLGAILSELGNSAGARKQLEKSLNLNPKNPEIYICLAEIENRRGNYQRAIDLCEKALQIDPNFKEAQRRRDLYARFLERYK